MTRNRKQVRGEGSWSEVVYWLRRRGIYSRRSAFRSTDHIMTRIYREHAEACIEAAIRLENQLQHLAMLEDGMTGQIIRSYPPQSRLLPTSKYRRKSARKPQFSP